mmetsp:Transcript_26636/g.26877  ORF Transcript_26636/g.26877 Transcript_26636/m.26877 type:complete len:160 (-) Transcript_26636:166-645(-)
MNRNGKWTMEEEAYSSKLIEIFLDGHANNDAEEGETLRLYLSKKLNCKPMRIAKKYSCRQILNNQYQHNKINKDYSIEDRQALDELRSRYLEKDAKVQNIRQKRKKYLKGSSVLKVRRVEETNEDHQIDSNVDDMFSFSWDDIDLIVSGSRCNTESMKE